MPTHIRRRPERGLEEIDIGLKLSRDAGASMELRIAISVAEVAQAVDPSSNGRAVLADAIGKVANGHKAPIVRRARELLVGISFRFQVGNM